ncbi:MAG: DNA-processing protein DprA [Actinomycetota bacterium]
MSTDAASLADRRARLALASLPAMGPARLRWLLAADEPIEVVAHLRHGRLPPGVGHAPRGVTRKLVDRWTATLRSQMLDELWAANSLDGGAMLAPADDLWPFVDDPEPPALLFTRGDPGLLVAPAMVAIVGTRRCSAVGRHVATELGAELAEAGVIVVSGLATGIDGCAHRGVLAAGGRPLAVVGSGLDCVYPAANRRLWFRTADVGLLISEAPAGTHPERWRFPARNRLIAALADAVVVVESHTSGGSMHTVHEAAERGRLVMAVPGAVTNPAAAGTNQLLAEGCPPVTGAADVIDALGLSSEAPAADRDRAAPRAAHGDASGGGRGAALSARQRLILAEARAGAVHLDELVTLAAGPGSPAASIHQVLADVQGLVDQGEVVLDGSTVSLVGPHSP